ncbi:MAG: hypothetical protein ABR905_09205, partial [Terracidiphilus sp.]
MNGAVRHGMDSRDEGRRCNIIVPGLIHDIHLMRCAVVDGKVQDQTIYLVVRRIRKKKFNLVSALLDRDRALELPFAALLEDGRIVSALHHVVSMNKADPTLAKLISRPNLT